MEYGHSCIRGEKDINVYSEIKNILSSLSYEFNDGNTKNKFLPLDVSVDSDWFLLFGVTRKIGIKLLQDHIKSRNLMERKWSKITQRKDVIEILLGNLESINGKKYDRNNLGENIKIFIILENMALKKLH